MPYWLSWLPLTGAIVIVGVTVGALSVAMVRPLLERATHRLAPSIRFHVLIALLATPLLSAAVFLKISFGPSVFDALGIIADHCHHHTDHAFHLCFVHGTPPTDLWPVLLTVPLFFAFTRRIATEYRSVVRARHWSRHLRALGRREESLDCWLVDADGLALTIGALRPEVFVSTGLGEALGPGQLEAVLAHEHAHRRRRDGLVKSVARVLSALHLPQTGSFLLEQIEVASEQACDAAAAAETGDPAGVAATIVAMARLTNGERTIPFAPAFGAHPVEQRVRALLDDTWAQPPGFLMATIAAALLIAFVQLFEQLHHAFETAVTYFF